MLKYFLDILRGVQGHFGTSFEENGISEKIVNSCLIFDPRSTYHAFHCFTFTGNLTDTLGFQAS